MSSRSQIFPNGVLAWRVAGRRPGRWIWAPHVSSLHVGLLFFAGCRSRSAVNLPALSFACHRTHSIELKFTIDKLSDLGYHFVCYLEQTRHAAPPLTPLDSALTGTARFCTILVQISPLESALTERAPASPLESALTKTPGVGVPQHFRATLCFSRHMRHVAPLSLVVSVDCAYFLSPQGCTLSNPKSSLCSPCLCGKSIAFILLQTSWRSAGARDG